MLTVVTQKLKGWKTLIFGHIVAIGGVLLLGLEALQGTDVRPLLPSRYADAIIAGIGVAIVLLRLVTTTPAFTADARAQKDRR